MSGRDWRGKASRRGQNVRPVLRRGKEVRQRAIQTIRRCLIRVFGVSIPNIPRPLPAASLAPDIIESYKHTAR
eukprot:770573-Amorphochlora_amoeboformis.AAC.1